MSKFNPIEILAEKGDSVLKAALDAMTDEQVAQVMRGRGIKLSKYKTRDARVDAIVAEANRSLNHGIKVAG